MNGTTGEEHTLEQHRTVEVERRVGARPERVFDALLDPSMVRTWLAAPDAGGAVSVELDARVGGTFSFVVRRDGETIADSGQYLEIDRPRALSFTWRVPRVSLETGVVTIQLMPVGNETAVTLRHEGVFAEHEERTERGWSAAIESIALLLARPREALHADEDDRRNVR